MDNFEININEYLPLRDLVYKNVRDAILSGRLPQGERLMEKDLSARLGVSRTPIREALRKLELEGYVNISPRKGAMVKKVTEKEISDVLEIRSVLEALAAKNACEKMTDDDKKRLVEARIAFEEAVLLGDVYLMAQRDVEFHDIIFLSTENDKLMQIVNNLREQIYRFRLTYLCDSKHIKNIIAEHQKIARSIIAGDFKAAWRNSLEHVEKQQKAITKP